MACTLFQQPSEELLPAPAGDLDPARIAVLRDEGAIVVDADGRLRVTQSGFPVLDAVVADLAA